MVNLNLIDMLPPSTKRMKEEQEIQRVLSEEYNNASYIQYRIQQNANIPSCDEYGISVFESDMGITPKKTDTLEQRIARCIMVWNNFLPYNWAALIRLLDTIIGRDNYTAVCDKLMLSIIYINPNVNRDELFHHVREMIPAKVGLSVIFRIHNEMPFMVYLGVATRQTKRIAPPIREGYSIRKDVISTTYNGIGLFNKKKCEVKE